MRDVHDDYARPVIAGQATRLMPTLSEATRDSAKNGSGAVPTAAPQIRLKGSSPLVAEPMPAVVRILQGADVSVRTRRGGPFFPPSEAGGVRRVAWTASQAPCVHFAVERTRI